MKTITGYTFEFFDEIGPLEKVQKITFNEE